MANYGTYCGDCALNRIVQIMSTSCSSATRAREVKRSQSTRLYLVSYPAPFAEVIHSSATRRGLGTGLDFTVIFIIINMLLVMSYNFDDVTVKNHSTLS